MLILRWYERKKYYAVRADGQNDQQVLQDGDQVYEQEEAEDEQIQSWII